MTQNHDHAIISIRHPGCDALVRMTVSNPDCIARETARVQRSGMIPTRIDSRHATVHLAPTRPLIRTCAPIQVA